MLSKNIFFSDELKDGVELKAKGLLKLSRNGFCVPDWIYIIPTVLDDYLKPHISKINKIFSDTDPSDNNSLSIANQKIGLIIKELHFSNEFKNQLRDHCDKSFSPNNLFSVRSCASVEDDLHNSWAGLFHTSLNVSFEDLIEAIKNCWISLFNLSTLKYFFKTHSNVSFDNFPKMAVIIQEMITSDYSGVIFTINPQGILNESVIVSAKSLGDKVVSNRISSSTYYYNLTDDISYCQSTQKTSRLSSENLQKLIDAIKIMSKKWPLGVDVEWAIKKNKLYFLQLRPITTLTKNKIPIVLDNSNLVESYPGVLSPLTISYASRMYKKIFTKLMIRCYPQKKFVSRYKSKLEKMIIPVNGRLYYCLNNWYDFIQFLPLKKRMLNIWQEMMGIKKESWLPKNNFNDISIWKIYFIYFNLFKTFLSVKSQMDKLNNDFIKIEQFFKNNFTKFKKSNDKLIILYSKLEKKVYKNWDITLFNDILAFVSTSLFKKYISILSSNNVTKITHDYLSYQKDLPSLLPIIEINKITKFVYKNPSLYKKLKKIKTLNSYEIFLKNFDKKSKVFIKMFNNYLDKYGDRCVTELILESQTFRQSPLLLLSQIINNKNTINYHKKSFKDLKKILPQSNYLSLFVANFLAKQARTAIINREISRLNRSRLSGMTRNIVLAIGENLTKEGKLKQKQDIFYLKINQLFNLSKYNNFFDQVKINYKKKINFQKIPDYSRLIFSNKIFNKQCSNISETKLTKVKVLFGTPCSSGEVTAEVVLVKNPKLNSPIDVNNKIIVAVSTDPGWVFLLSQAAGIIVERGSILSHTAIISRELGIPSIVGVKNATKLFQNKEIIHINGQTGKIKTIS